ncbi:MAG TPA: AlpA family phage regulatory protein [Gallionella sp.]|nr:AlpA family phage regulatory protein [Gallionella sp.]
MKSKAVSAAQLSAIPHVQGQQPQQVLVRRKVVEQLTSLSRSRIYALMSTGDFPKPAARLGSMSVAWLLSDVDFWISSRIAASRKAV